MNNGDEQTFVPESVDKPPFFRLVQPEELFPEAKNVPSIEHVPELIGSPTEYTKNYIRYTLWDAETLRSMENLRGSIFLDIGAGKDTYGLWLAKLFENDYCGIEFSKNFCNQLQEKISSFNQEEWQRIAGESPYEETKEFLLNQDLTKSTMRAAVWNGDMIAFLKALRGDETKPSTRYKLVVNLIGIGSGLFARQPRRAKEVASCLSEILDDGSVLLIASSDFNATSEIFIHAIKHTRPFTIGSVNEFALIVDRGS